MLGVGIATSTDGSTGEATIIGPPGTYNLTARAEINGTLTTFGDLKITLVGGACQSFEIGAPTLMLDVVNNCNNEVTVSGKATDKAVPIQSVQVNGQNIAFTTTGNADNEVSFSITLPLQAGENKIETAVTNNAGKTASDSRTVNAYPAGAFIVGDEGIVKIDWLYDGGRYQGQFGIFSLDGMSQFTPGSPEFITEAVNRVLSDSEQGYLVFSDSEEGARFSGILGHEIRDWNAGPYKGVKSFPMKPGSCFATVLVPNSTFSSLSQNPATTDTNKRPLFSLVSANSAYGMVMGQMADVNGMGKAYSYEDKNAETSDRDFNDLIVQITGATGDLPTIDSLKSDRSSRDKREYGDWRDSAFGQLILEHVEASEIAETTPHITVTLASSAADMVIYDPQKRFIGKDGGTIPGAAFEMKSGVQIVSLAALTAGDYRIVLRSVGDGGSGTLEIAGFVGTTQVASEQMPFEIAAHQSLDSVLSADAFLSSQTIAVEIPGVNEPGYDFNGDGVTDNADVALIVKHWNSCRNQQKYDPFFDLNDDGCITVADVMKVLNAKTVK
ncbi:MAG: DUF4114 domain-containing protein [Desulfobacteraceae bacterium]|nr:DUF4114 domain-containing protein [Desulfobacteraceae bacterium]